MLATNIQFNNGWEDGWRWAGMLESKDSATQQWDANVMNCINAGHCTDIGNRATGECAPLTWTRWLNGTMIKKW